MTINASQVVPRDFDAAAVDGWIRIEHPNFHIELEGAGVFGVVGQTSEIPGVLDRGPVTSTQYGLALESEFGGPSSPVRGGFDSGVASGDSAPGFGALVPAGAATAVPGDVTGSQVSYPNHTTSTTSSSTPTTTSIRSSSADHRDGDRRVLLPSAHPLDDGGGGAGDADALGRRDPVLRDAAQLHALRPAAARLRARPHVTWGHQDGFSIVLEYAVLFPFSAFNNPALGLTAQPAQLLRLRLNYAF